jgi:hypothetical protein
VSVPLRLNEGLDIPVRSNALKNVAINKLNIMSQKRRSLGAAPFGGSSETSAGGLSEVWISSSFIVAGSDPEGGVSVMASVILVAS